MVSFQITVVFFVAGSKDTIQQPTVYVVEWIVRLVYGAVPLAIV